MDDGALAVAGPLEQVSAHGIEAVVSGQSPVPVEYLQVTQAGIRAVHHRGSYGLVQQHHRVVGHLLEQMVQREDLRPVGVPDIRGLVVNRRDGGLELVRAGGSPRECARDERDAFRDQRPVPECPILLVQRDQLPGRPGAGRPGRRGWPVGVTAAGFLISTTT